MKTEDRLETERRVAEIEEQIGAIMHAQNNSDEVTPEAIERSARVLELGEELKALRERL